MGLRCMCAKPAHSVLSSVPDLSLSLCARPAFAPLPPTPHHASLWQVVRHFLEGVRRAGGAAYAGFPALNIVWQEMESKALKRAYGMAPHQKGVLVRCRRRLPRGGAGQGRLLSAAPRLPIPLLLLLSPAAEPCC